MILECDMGNTRCKWRVLDGEQVVERGSWLISDDFESFDLTAQISRVKIASVVSDDSLVGLRQYCREIGVDPEFATSTPEVAGIVNGYQQPSKLGVDRWLSVVAAYKRRQSAVLVIDTGTAFKADLVSAQGRHLGGYIAPGIGLMESSLLSGTDKVRFDCEDYTGGVAFGCSTADAVNAGLLAAQLGAVYVAIEEAKRRIPEGFAILLTGGDSGLITDSIFASMTDSFNTSHTIEEVPELVLDGLRWLLP